jgi:hypothetical protein
MLAINLWSGQKKSLIAACKAAGITEPQVGQQFVVTHTGGIGNAKSPRKFTYVLTDGPSGVAGVLEVAPVAGATTAPPVANAVDTAKQLLAAGMSSGEVAQAVGLPETTIAAIANVMNAA